jgi:CRP/FNR family cyclic AMP-dependent transcriptional regulator
MAPWMAGRRLLSWETEFMQTIVDYNELEEIELFRGLTRAQASQLEGLLHRKTLPAGTLFITVEQPGELVYVISSGAVKVFIDDADGAEVILAILAAGEVIGEMGLIDCFGRSANAVTLEETVIFWMDRASFRQCLSAAPVMRDNLLRLLCNRLRLANERIQSLALQDVEGRIARQLLAFAEVYGRTGDGGETLIPFRLTQSDLAGLIGATRVRVNQVIAAYKQRGYISVGPRYRITIHKQDALGRRARRSIQKLNGQAGVDDRKAKTRFFEAGVPDFTGAV